MRFGICTNLLTTQPDKTGVERIDKMAEVGFDYIELPVAEMMELSDEQFALVKAKVEASPIRCETCNNLFPGYIRLTGANVDRNIVDNYIKKAFERIGSLGAQVVVFGSGGAKRVPEGFPYDDAFEQVVDVSIRVADEAAKYGVTIAAEPIRMPDCNIINTFAEGVALARRVNRPNFKVLIDYYHMRCEHEPAEVLLKYGREYLAHVHMSYPNVPYIDGWRDENNIRHYTEKELEVRNTWRTFPAFGDDWDYSDIVTVLKEIGYSEHMSLEAGVSDFDRQAEEAIRFLRKVMNGEE